MLELNEMEATAKVLGLEVVMLEIRQADDIAPALAELKDRAEALHVPANPLATKLELNTKSHFD
jgi:ABC-type uncharacterized transport system substrate-binding protein